MGVTVRMFAAMREAAGVAATEIDAGHLGAILDEVAARFGPDARRVIGVCAVVVDGQRLDADADADVEVPDGSEVALLPPVSGGCAVAACGGVR